MPYRDHEKQLEYQKAWVARRKAEWLLEHGPCRACGSWKELQVDHKDPTTKVSHRVWSWSQTRRDAELAKCQVLCKRCHQNKTRLDGAPKNHGRTMYENYGCRCDECRAAKAKNNAKRSKRYSPD